MANRGSGRLRGLAARAAAVIRIEAIWLVAESLDMRAGTEAALSRVMRVFGSVGVSACLTRAQFDALVLGPPWQRVGEAGVITPPRNCRRH